jgi:uncharacterized membrane protein (UPF0182 family)
MASRQVNPFRFVGPLPLGEMIDREPEAEDLLALALAGHSLRLVAPRYYGKTTLLRRVLAAADREGMGTALIDFRDVLSMPEVVARVERGYERLARALRGRVLEHDPAADPESVLLGLLELPTAVFERDGTRSLIVFDEIQDVLAVSGAEGSIRSVIQEQGDHTTYALVSSAPGMMARLLQDPGRGLVADAVPRSLGPLPIDDVAAYVTDRFGGTDRDPGAALSPMLEFTRGHPQRTMMLAHYLWDQIPRGAQGDEAAWRSALDRAVADASPSMMAVWTALPANERRVARALAVVSTPLHGRETAAAVGIKRSSIGKALASLVDRADVIDDEGQPQLTDPMFELWLQRLGLTPAAGDDEEGYAPPEEHARPAERARPPPAAEAPREDQRAADRRPEARDLGPRDEPRLKLEAASVRTGRSARGLLANALQPRMRTFLVLGVIGVPFAVAFAAAQFITDILWFDEVGQVDNLLRIRATQLLLVVVVGGLTAAFLIANARYAVEHAPSPASLRSIPAVVANSALFAAILGWSARGDWQSFLLWFHQQDFGVEDPLHHRDVGFFVFSLPFLEKLSSLLILIFATGALVAIFVHVHTGALTWRPLRATHAARVHLAFLGGLALLLLAWRLHLETFAAESRQTPAHAAQPFPGPHFVDANVRIPALRVLSYVAVVGAVAVVAAPFLAARGHPRAAKRAAILPWTALAAVSIVSLSWAPSLVQRYIVDPNAPTKEAPFLEHAITATRQAFDLSDVDVHRYDPKPRITPGELSAHRASLANVQLWDSKILRLRMQQLSSATPYYRAGETTVDAVPAGKGSRITVIGPRELDVQTVRSAGRGWANGRLVYTHGYGAFRTSGTKISPTEEPRENNRAVPLRQPRIYFGEQQSGAPGWVVVKSRRDEFDRPVAEGPARRFEYTGSGGISLSSPFVRAMFALRQGSLPLLLSKQITDQSRIILHRDVIERLKTVAPFIRWEEHPTALVVGGRIVFLAAGYTESDSYPYAHQTRVAGSFANYARAAVHATVDAYSGRIRLYVADRTDPILRAWDAAFPGTFKPVSGMPPGIRARLRYPSALFDAQAQLYQRFHVTSPSAFASGADAWTPPARLSGPIEVAGDIRFDEDDEDELRRRMKPSYRFATPAGEDKARLLRGVLYSPRGAQNLVATLDGWLNRRGVPKLASRSLPRDRVTPGPAQVSRLVNLTPRIANSLGVRNREVTDVGRSSLDSIWLGEPHVVFIAGGLLQVQTIYEASNSRGIARIFGVTVFLNGRAGMGDTLSEALRQALRLPPSVEVERVRDPVPVGRALPIRLQVSNGLTERIRVASKRGTVFSRHLRVRNGVAVVRWIPRKPGRYDVPVSVLGLDGSVATDKTTLTVRPRRRGPDCAQSEDGGPPTVEFTGLPHGLKVGRPVDIGFTVANGSRETVRIESGRGQALTWELHVCTGRGAVEWVPREPGDAHVQIVVRGSDGRTVEAATELTIRNPGRQTTPGQQATPGQQPTPGQQATPGQRATPGQQAARGQHVTGGQEAR